MNKQWLVLKYIYLIKALGVLSPPGVKCNSDEVGIGLPFIRFRQPSCNRRRA